jgi:hypothetical protein
LLENDCRKNIYKKGQYYFIFYIVNILLEVFFSHETLEGLRLVEALDLAVRDGDHLTVLDC